MSTELVQFTGQALLTALVVGAPLLIKLGRLQQQVVSREEQSKQLEQSLREALARIERAQEELLRREVFTSEIRGLEARLVRIEERLQRLEEMVFPRAKSET